MSVRITDPLCYRKIAQVEGAQWVRDEGQGMDRAAMLGQPMSSYSFAGALQCWISHRTGTVYGLGGFNRYFLREDGRVAFSKWHCSSAEQLALAIELGFDVE